VLVLSPELDNLAGVYAIRNRLNGKRYTGSTKRSFAHRRYSHLYELRRGEHHSPALQAAFNKYSEAAFEFVILEVVENPTRERVLAAEQRHIDQQSEYNVTRIAGAIEGERVAAWMRAGAGWGTGSRFKGVSRQGKSGRGQYDRNLPWEARIQLDGKQVRLGYFGDEVEAALAYDAAVEKYFGAGAFTNFPRGDAEPVGSQRDNVNYYYTIC
jgi:hypothetical protein